MKVEKLNVSKEKALRPLTEQEVTVRSLDVQELDHVSGGLKVVCKMVGESVVCTATK